MPGRMEFSLNLPPSPSNPPRRQPAAPLRFLIMADFSGRADREMPGPLDDLSSRPLLTVDADSLDSAMSRLAPKLRLTGAEPGSTLMVSFRQVDDFHPDALFQRLEAFSGSAPQPRPAAQSGQFCPGRCRIGPVSSAVGSNWSGCGGE